MLVCGTGTPSISQSTWCPPRTGSGSWTTYEPGTKRVIIATLFERSAPGVWAMSARATVVCVDGERTSASGADAATVMFSATAGGPAMSVTSTIAADATSTASCLPAAPSRYIPIGMAANWNAPFASVTVDRASPSVTRTPGNGAPLGSRTTPRTPPKIVAWSDDAKRNSKALQINHRRIESPPPFASLDGKPSNVARRRELGRNGMREGGARHDVDAAARVGTRLEAERRLDGGVRSPLFDGRRRAAAERARPVADRAARTQRTGGAGFHRAAAGAAGADDADGAHDTEGLQDQHRCDCAPHRRDCNRAALRLTAIPRPTK